MSKSIEFTNGKKQILSGAMHYFRIHPDYWRDRLIKLRQCGLNTVETYIAWNFHELREGEFDFSGARDFVRFLKIAYEEGLHAIVRPGPYICSEWDLGGLPAWLLNKPGLRLRCCNRPYLDAIQGYLSRVLELLRPLQHTQGGPVIAIQLENEYGSYGNDLEYLRFLKQFHEEAGIAVPLFTSDGNSSLHLSGGALPDVLATINFRNRPAENFAIFDKMRPDDPKFVMELWDGGAHHWGRPYPWHDPEGVRQDVRAVLEHGYHMNLYMFHGGSNFGFMNGANWGNGEYIPMLSTYDVDAALSEEGDPTPKYYAIQQEIKKHYPDAPTGEPVIAKKRAYGEIELPRSVRLPDALPHLSTAIRSATPEPMESFGQSYGYILYRTHLTHPGLFNIFLDGMQDRAVVMMDGVVAGVVYRNQPQHCCMIRVPENGGVLDILVENMGRVNFGNMMEHERKGLRGVRNEYQYIFGWEIYPLEMTSLDALPWRAATAEACGAPAFYQGILEVDEPCDTFLTVSGGVKGQLFLNGFNLGRYWNIGPQNTLYVPAPLLRRGKNEIVVFDQLGAAGIKVVSRAERDFGPRFKMQI